MPGGVRSRDGRRCGASVPKLSKRRGEGCEGRGMVTKRPTMAEIAREANVAISTVSKVLNGHTDVSVATRKHIEQLLADRGYQRPHASRRPGRRSDLVDLVINELDSVWGLSILTGVEEVVEAAGLGLV